MIQGIIPDSGDALASLLFLIIVLVSVCAAC